MKSDATPSRSPPTPPETSPARPRGDDAEAAAARTFAARAARMLVITRVHFQLDGRTAPAAAEERTGERGYRPRPDRRMSLWQRPPAPRAA